jgi:tetratricopeptide (TPR) repeat protein
MVRRVLIPIVIAAAAIALAWRACEPDIRCNRVWAVVTQGNRDAMNLDDFEALVLVRNNVPAAMECANRACPNAQLMYELGETYRRLGRHDDAIALLERALRFDRRPEIFITLGDSLAQSGRVEEGVQMLIAGAHFLGTADVGRLQYAMRYTAFRDMAFERMGIR